MKIPGLVIAGTNSGCGKTTISIGIMAALSRRGLGVKPFKVGPDYIDPMFHSFVTGTASGNLDSWMLSEDVLKHLYLKNSSDGDIAVIEGVMGIYDGFGGTSITGSTAHVSKIVGAPVVLVVNAEGISLSIAAIANGFKDFDKETHIKGVILNKIKSTSHYQMLKEIIENNTGLKVYGYLKPMEELVLKSRHLGLVTSGEIEDLTQKINLLSSQIEETIDLDGLLELSKESCEISEKDICQISGVPVSQKPVRIGIARDKAFCFYYNDNLRLLEELGAQLIEFSPLNDHKLPDNIQGLYIGGGYPEVFAEELSQNTKMKHSIKEAVDKGLPTYAECGGLMYLSKEIHQLSGEIFTMVGAVCGVTKMTEKLSKFGYVEIEAACDNVLAREGQKIRGHEFHYSAIEVEDGVQNSWKVSKKRNSGKGSDWICGYKKNNMLAGYPHLHFYSNIEFAKGFVEACAKWQLIDNLEK